MKADLLFYHKHF